MDGLIELVFESVPDHSVNDLVDDLVNTSEVLELTQSELGAVDVDKVDGDFMKLATATTDPISVFLRCAPILVGDFSIHRPLVQVLRYSGTNDVVVSFDSSDIAKGDKLQAVKSLMNGCKALALNRGVPLFYCGYEPASDVVTRLFTGDRVGPLALV